MKSKAWLVVVSVISLVFIAGLFLPGCGGEKPDVRLKDPTMEPVEAAGDGQMITIDDVINMENVSEFRISPDGLHVAWVVDSEKLYLSGTGRISARPVEVTGSGKIACIRWSPDSTKLAFLTDAPYAQGEAPGESQVWILNPESLVKSSVTADPQGVIGLTWAGTKKILYTLPEDGPEPIPGDDTVRVSDYSDTPVRLFSVDLETFETERLTGNDDRIISASASPDGKRVFYTRTACAQDIYLWQWKQVIPFEHYILDLEDGTEDRVFEESRWIAGGGGQWSPDSGTLYVIDNYSEDEVLVNYLTVVRSLDLDSGQEEEVELDWERGVDQMNSLAYGCLAPVEGGFITILADGTHPKAAKYSRAASGWEKSVLEGSHQGNIFALDASLDGRTLFYKSSTSNDPSQLYIAEMKGDSIDGAKAVTNLNSGLETKNLGRAEIITWIGAEGDEIEGTLHYPPGYSSDKKYPLVLCIHGGPPECVCDVFLEAWHWPARLMAQKGALVLTANYHGSLNYGLEFQKSLLDNNYYRLPIQDFEKGIDRLDELGMIDADMLGTMGWSNGGILSNALIAQDQRFKAASCGAGGAEWISDWSISWFGQALMGEYWFTDPVEDPSYYTDPEIAPFYAAENVKTPVIMFHGESDRNVAASMSWTTFRGIQKYGETPVDLYIFPGEPHMLQSEVHQQRKLEEESKWFDKYLFSEEN